MTREAWIIDAVRTPRGIGKQGKGALSHLHPHRLGATVLGALAERNALRTEEVDDVIWGCSAQIGKQGTCIGRMSALDAGWSIKASGVTLDRFCGSGITAVNLAAATILSGMEDLVVAGGVESMSRQPMGSDGAGIDGHNRHLREMYPLVPQGISADLIATIEGFTREDCDRFALASQMRAKAAIESGRFAKSIVPVRGPDGGVLLDHDEHPRAQTTLEGLGKLEPSFVQLGRYVQKSDQLSFDEKARKVYPDVAKIEHVHTAGNSSGIVDGAAAVLVASPDYARAHGLKPRAKVRAMATHGAEPIIMLTAPVPATERCLKKAGMTIRDIDLVEINEAFAAVPLKVIRDCNIDPEIVNVNGGAIALGHPLGATGAMLLGTILDELERRDKTTGLVTMCIGGGMGITTIIERV